jgi:hypothetical protein
MFSKRHVALLAAVACAGVVVSISAAGAVAAPPNDKASGATVVSSLPFKASVDTRGATTDSQDAQVNQSCGAPVTNNSVWYKYKATKSSLLVVDSTGSDYSSGVIIAEGTPGNLSTDACAPVSTSVQTIAGSTYWILVFDDTGSGGSLQLSIHGPGPKPSNDTSAGAKAVTSLPYHDALDTTGATSDAQDTQVNKTCGAPDITHSVWYKFTAGAKNTNVLFDASNSSFAAGVIVATGNPGALTTLTCGPGYAISQTTPGSTYWVLVFDVGGTGGNLDLHITEAPPAPTMKVTTEPTVGVGPKGNAYMHATYTCTHADHAEVILEMVEIVGNKVATGLIDDIAAQCDGTAHGIPGLMTPTSNHFAPGKAAAFRSGIACNSLQCAQYDASSVVQLLAGGRPSGIAGRAAATVHRTVQHATRYMSHRAPAPNARTWGK